MPEKDASYVGDGVNAFVPKSAIKKAYDTLCENQSNKSKSTQLHVPFAIYKNPKLYSKIDEVDYKIDQVISISISLQFHITHFCFVGFLH